MTQQITKEQFIANWCEASGMSLDEFDACGYVVKPCNCDYENCRGWAVSGKDEEEVDE